VKVSIHPFNTFGVLYIGPYDERVTADQEIA